MTWNPVTAEERRVALAVVTWIRTAREAGYGGPDWLPSRADISKSALFERLRSGKPPLEEPPPVGMSCPWYALVEDPGPHYVFDAQRGTGSTLLGTDEFSILQYPYRIVEEIGPSEFVVRDGRRETSYRFRLWYDADWEHPGGRARGGWFMRNVALADPAAEG